MRLSYISIIFIVIMIPIIIVYSLLMDAKIRAVELEISYNKILGAATADAIRALEQNTSVYYINPDYLKITNSGDEEKIKWLKGMYIDVNGNNVVDDGERIGRDGIYDNDNDEQPDTNYIYDQDSAIYKFLIGEPSIDISSVQNELKLLKVNNNFFENYSTVADSLKRSTEAMINTFLTSISTSFGTSSIARKDIKANLPAMLITMYNGYYIYSPDDLNNNGVLEHTLKPFTFYSEKYNDNTIVVNYSLDNFVTVMGEVPNITNLNNNSKSYRTYSGYIVDLNTFRISGSNVQFKSSITGNWEAMTDYNDYYKNAINFTKWFASLKLTTQKYGYSEVTNTGKLMYDAGALPNNIVDMTVFEEEKRQVAQQSIITNLEIAITNYNNDAANNYVFKMPKISETDWDKILSNISITAFLQGMPIGTKYYNNYSISTSAESITSFYLDKKDIFFTEDNAYPTTYHRIDCPELTLSSTTEAYPAKYYWRTYELKSTSTTRQEILETNFPWNVEDRSIRRLFPVHMIRNADGRELYQKYNACYYCITNKNYTPSMTTQKEKAYYEAVARVISENDIHSKRINFKP